MQIKRASAWRRGSFQLVDISKLGLNSKIKKFSDSFICGKGYSPPEGGENSFLSTVCEPRHGAGARFIDVIMLIAKAKSVCYNHFVGRRALPVVASRFCYRRREGYAMTPYEIIMERILSIENPVLFRSIIEVNAYRVLNWRGRINSIYSYFCSALVFFRASFSSCHLFSLLFDVSILHLTLEVYTEFGTVSGNAGRTERKRAGYI